MTSTSSSTPVVASVTMGYGHLRAAYPIAERLGVEVLAVDEPPIADAKDARLWGWVRGMHELLWQHVNQLPYQARNLVVALSSNDAPAYADFAQRSGMPIGSIGPTRMRSLRKLRSSLEDDGLGAHAWH